MNQFSAASCSSHFPRTASDKLRQKTHRVYAVRTRLFLALKGSMRELNCALPLWIKALLLWCVCCVWHFNCSFSSQRRCAGARLKIHTLGQRGERALNESVVYANLRRIFRPKISLVVWLAEPFVLAAKYARVLVIAQIPFTISSR